MTFYDRDMLKAVMPEKESDLKSAMRESIRILCKFMFTERERMIIEHRLDGNSLRETSSNMKVSIGTVQRGEKTAIKKAAVIVRSIIKVLENEECSDENL